MRPRELVWLLEGYRFRPALQMKIVRRTSATGLNDMTSLGLEWSRLLGQSIQRLGGTFGRRLDRTAIVSRTRHRIEAKQDGQDISR